jgi:hypothetical protein
VIKSFTVEQVNVTSFRKNKPIKEIVYKVLSTMNTTKPKIEDRLTEDELNGYINNGYKVMGTDQTRCFIDTNKFTAFKRQDPDLVS